MGCSDFAVGDGSSLHHCLLSPAAQPLGRTKARFVAPAQRVKMRHHQVLFGVLFGDRFYLRFVPELQADLDVGGNGFAVLFGGLVEVLLHFFDGGGTEFFGAGEHGYGADVAGGVD